VTKTEIILQPGKWLLHLPDLESSEAHLFLALAALGQSYSFEVRTAAIAKAAGCSAATARKVLKSLSAKGLLSFEWASGREGRCSVSLSRRWVEFREVA
jgi:MarR-like DNA-binding transcriptional regulator SgrR of sgrS sRNA